MTRKLWPIILSALLVIAMCGLAGCGGSGSQLRARTSIRTTAVQVAPAPQTRLTTAEIRQILNPLQHLATLGKNSGAACKQFAAGTIANDTCVGSTFASEGAVIAEVAATEHEDASNLGAGKCRTMLLVASTYLHQMGSYWAEMGQAVDNNDSATEQKIAGEVAALKAQGDSTIAGKSGIPAACSSRP